MNMNISQLQYFISIAESGSLVAAARDYGITKQALSKYLSRITQEYGVALVEKHHGKIALTDAGRSFYEHAREIMAIYDRMISSVCNRRDEYTLRIGVTRNIGITTISRIIPEFTDKYPKTFLAVQEGYSADLINSVINGIQDLALNTDVETYRDDCEVEPLFKGEIYIAIPIGHPYLLEHPGLTEKDAIDINELRQYEFCLSSNKLSLPYQIAAKILGGTFHDLGRIRESSSTKIIETNIAIGIGIGFLPITKYPERIRLFPLKSPVYIYHSLYYKKGTQLSQEARYLVDLYQEAIRQESVSGWYSL